MSLRATDWGWKQDSISSTQKLVLLDLCDRANKDHVCWPKQATIAGRTRLTERAVNTALKVLVELGLINRRPRMIGKKRTSDWITLLVSGPGTSPMGTASPPDPTPIGGDSTIVPPSETGSGDHQNDVPKPTGTSFSVINNDEPPRQKQTNPIFLEPFPEPHRPDQDALTYAARVICSLSADLGTAIDWSAAGIEDLRLVVEWLDRYEEKAVTSCLIEVARRNGSGQPIRSWRYFEAEILKLPPFAKA